MRLAENPDGRRFIEGAAAVVVLVVFVSLFFYGISPASADRNAASVIFEVKQGQGFREIIGNLGSAGIIRSKLTAETLSLLNGSALHMQPGFYRLSPAMSAPQILGELASGRQKEITVTIPEGSNIYQIDSILSEALVIHHGDLVRTSVNFEGKLFPDTYKFFTASDVKDVIQKFTDNFNSKAAPLLGADEKNAADDLILASIVEKEVPSPDDQKIVAGILKKRLSAGMPLQVDATVCYAVQQKDPLSKADCRSLDLKINSPYNTYLYKGLPPGPIGNPGISAVLAILHPKSSAYWFYLSEPGDGKTIFSKTLDEQHQNTFKYLKSN